MDPQLEQLKPETIDKLAENAHAAGLSLDAYVNTLLGLLNDGTALSELTDEAFEAVLDQFARGSEHIPPLPPDFSPADIYSDHDQMSYLFDTNVLLRLANTSDPAHAVARNALGVLPRRREILCFTPQVLAEFWSVCTRPASARGGFGLQPAEAERRVRVIERYLRLLSDSLATYHEWRQLLIRHAVSGVEVYDAYLVASMHVQGITHLLTFNAEDFARYPNIAVLEPQYGAQS